MILGIAVLLGGLAGCARAAGAPVAGLDEDYSAIDKVFPGVAIAHAEKAASRTDYTGDFSESLIYYLYNNGFENENFLVSPTSCRAALALAAAGAEGETKEELLSAMGFENMEELNEWYASLLEKESKFKKEIDDFNQMDDETYEMLYSDERSTLEGAFTINNSVWKNTDMPGTFSDEYINYVRENYGAVAQNAAKETITGDVNNWINENTDGMIPSISSDLSRDNMLLINTLYLRSGWSKEFSKNGTKEGNFTAYDGSTVKKQFMHQLDTFAYYEDQDCKFIRKGLTGGAYVVFVIGDDTGLLDKLPLSESKEVDVTIPKFETESIFSGNDFIGFMRERGATLAFSDKADFSVMSKDVPMKVDDIVQKTRIKTDEEGLEAAAVTMISMKAVMAAQNEKRDIKQFNANQPFKYYILMGSYEDAEILFYGQIVK